MTSPEAGRRAQTLLFELDTLPPQGAITLLMRGYILYMWGVGIYLRQVTRRLGDINMCTTFHGSTANSYRRASVWTKIMDQPILPF